MEFTIGQRELLKGLEKIQGLITEKSNMPILSNILISAIDNICLIATDLQISIKDTYKSEIKQPGQVTLEYKKLFNLTQKLQGEITFKQIDHGWLELTCKNHKTTLAILPAEEYPSIPEYKEFTEIKIESSILKDMIKKVIFSVSNDLSRLSLNNILFEIKENEITLISTDGHRLCKISKPHETNLKLNFELNKKSALLLMKVIKDEIIFNIDNNHIIFKEKDLILISREQIGNKFPAWEGIVPEINGVVAEINKETLLKVLKRVSACSDKDSSIILEFTEDCLNLKLAGIRNNSLEKIKIKYKGDDKKIRLNPDFLIDVVTVCDDDIDIYIEEHDKPLLIGNFDTYKCVIMPMRLNDGK